MDRSCLTMVHDNFTTLQLSCIAGKAVCGYDKVLPKDDMISAFGLCKTATKWIWKLLVKYATLPSSSHPLHLYWWLYQVKKYPTVKDLKFFTKVDHKTSDRHIAPIKLGMLAIAPYVIDWRRRKIGDNGTTCLTYYDGVDCLTNNPKKKTADGDDDTGFANRKMYKKKHHDHKFNHAGLRYGLGTCIKTGEIVCVHGPYEPGAVQDITIYKQRVVPILDAGEMVEADRGFRHPTCRNPEDYYSKSEKLAKGAVANRHENINNKLKFYRSLFHQFRHPRNTHKYYFVTAAVCVNAMIRLHGPIYPISY